MNDIQQKAYARYQMHWMFTHDITLKDIFTAVEDAQDDGELFKEWIESHGFGEGSLWVCPDEFLDAEYQEKEYMRDILDNSEYISYLQDTDAMQGYMVVDYDGTGMLEIQRDDSKPICPNDFAAVALAIQDGIELIPVEELPENFDRRYLGWIDTPENRASIKKYCAEMQQSEPRKCISATVTFDPSSLDELERAMGVSIQSPEDLAIAVRDAVDYAVKLQTTQERDPRSQRKHDQAR